MTAGLSTRTAMPWWLKILVVFAAGAAIWLGLTLLGNLFFGGLGPFNCAPIIALLIAKLRGRTRAAALAGDVSR